MPIAKGKLNALSRAEHERFGNSLPAPNVVVVMLLTASPVVRNVPKETIDKISVYTTSFICETSHMAAKYLQLLFKNNIIFPSET